MMVKLLAVLDSDPFLYASGQSWQVELQSKDPHLERSVLLRRDCYFCPFRLWDFRTIPGGRESRDGQEPEDTGTDRFERIIKHPGMYWRVVQHEKFRSPPAAVRQQDWAKNLRFCGWQLFYQNFKNPQWHRTCIPRLCWPKPTKKWRPNPWLLKCEDWKKRLLSRCVM